MAFEEWLKENFHGTLVSSSTVLRFSIQSVSTGPSMTSQCQLSGTLECVSGAGGARTLESASALVSAGTQRTQVGSIQVSRDAPHPSRGCVRVRFSSKGGWVGTSQNPGVIPKAGHSGGGGVEYNRQ